MDLPEPTTIAGVQDLFARYAHTIDRRDFAGFAELFAEDAQFALADNECRGRDNIRVFMTGAMKAPGGTHIITNVSVRATHHDGRHSVVADYLLTRRPEPDAPYGIVGVGIYESVVAVDDEQWRFAEHRIIPR
jgi:uncharacterized protein (TIGR02246 family)